MKSNIVGPYVAFLVMVVGFFGLCAPAAAQSHVSKSTTARHELSIGGYARTNRNCEGVNLPEVHLDQAPEHGVLCLRRGNVRLKIMFGPDLQQCVDKRTSGVHIIYRARAGYSGADKVRYTVRFPKAQHSVDVDLTIHPDVSPSDRALKDRDAPVDDNGQPLGSIPECSALVS